MGKIYGFAKDAGLIKHKFENMVITLKPLQSYRLERRLEAMGYRLRGEQKCSIDKFLFTMCDGSYHYGCDKSDALHSKFKPVNFKDIVGSQITTVDFVKGFVIGFIICLILIF